MIRKVGVIGSGQMGNGIAHVAALAGFDVVLNDVSADQLNSAMATINANLSRQVLKKLITDDDREKALARISQTQTFDGLADCDLVIETAVEKEEVKRKIFQNLCTVLKPEAIVASNTSSISITRLAASTDRPEKFIGIHFMNPVPLMELVELIRGIATGDATFDTAKEFVIKLGKQIAVSEDFPAFIVNRILLPMINEAIYTLYKGWVTSKRSMPPCGSARITRWARLNSPISLGSTPACRSCRCCTKDSPTPSTGPVRCW